MPIFNGRCCVFNLNENAIIDAERTNTLTSVLIDTTLVLTSI